MSETRTVEIALIPKKYPNKPKATKDGEGRWVLPSTFKSGKRYMFDTDADFEEYRKQRKAANYERLCERNDIDRNGKKGPKVKRKPCPTCGSLVNFAKVKAASPSDGETEPRTP